MGSQKQSLTRKVVAFSSPAYKNRCCNYIVATSCIQENSLSRNDVKDRLEVPIVLALLYRVMPLLQGNKVCSLTI